MTQKDTGASQDKPPGKPKAFQIQIDRTHYEVHQERMTGKELRAVPNPAIGPDRDLYVIVPGGTDDKITDEDPVSIKNGLRFYTTPALINPGRS